MDAPLADRLGAMADDVRRLAPKFAQIVDPIDHVAQDAAVPAARFAGPPDSVARVPAPPIHLRQLRPCRHRQCLRSRVHRWLRCLR